VQATLTYYTQHDSPLHRMDGRWKLAAVVVGLIAVVTLHTVPAAALALAAVLGLLLVSRLPWSWLLLRLSGVALFLSMFLVILPLTMPGDDVALGPIRVSSEGIRLGALICLKALTVVALALLLTATAPFETTLKAARSFHVPGLLVQLLMLTYRYVFLFGDELHKLRIALRLRRYRNRPSLHSYRTIGHVTGTLLVRSYERAERVGQAMRCRGFDGQFRTLHAFRTRWQDVAWFVVIVCLLGVVPVGMDWWGRAG
jgi:cobalt/nickel transport system permease protein